jgi:pimeloyl-ACP methyl ester carboxylesterase
MGYLPVKGLQVYYVTQGKGEPLLLLHGGLGTVEDFTLQVPVLAEHFQTFAFERSGHGHTADTEEPFGYDVMAKQTVAFIEALGLGATNLVGWSDGAIVALLVAVSRPDFVKSLILVSGIFGSV